MQSKAEETSRHVDDLGIYGLPGDVRPWDIRFDPDDRAFLEARVEGRFALTVWAEPGLVEGRVVVRTEDGITSHAMEATVTARFVYWTAELGPFRAPAAFSFAFRSPAARAVYRVRSGVSASVERLDRWTIDPTMPTVDVPVWAQGAVIYQVFPDRFHNGDPGNDPEGVEPWGSTPHGRQFQGGDLVGVRQKLEYLDGLGVDCLYLNPVFTSPSNHRYDAVDYYTVDPRLGGNKGLEDLIAAAHRRDIRVVLDASFNHVHPHFFAFRDLMERGTASPYRDWFVVHDWPVRIRHRPYEATEDTSNRLAWTAEQTGLPLEAVSGPGRSIEPTYEAWYDVPTMPRVQLSNPQARRYMLDVAAHWIEQYDIDGWRMDVVRYVDADFWNDLRNVAKAVKPDAYLLAEVMGDAHRWLQGDAFDATMNYSFCALALAFFARGELDGSGLLDGASRLLHQHAWAVNLANHNLIGSHDTPRFLTEADGDVNRLLLATVFQLTFPGAPGIYYGDEIGLEGGPDPLNRVAFPWERDESGHPVSDAIRDLTALRRTRPPLRWGRWEPVGAQGSAIAFQRRLGAECVTVVINVGPDGAAFELGSSVELLWGNATVAGSRVTVAGGDAALLA